MSEPEMTMKGDGASGLIPCDVLVFGASEILTNQPGCGGNSMAVTAGKVVAVGDGKELRQLYSPRQLVDGQGLLGLPGFLDGHTHPAFAVGRAEEFDWRAQGLTYLEIAERGGGIHSSVRAVRSCGEEQLTQIVAGHFRRMLRHGTTACEAKSGYGLSVEDELKSLRAIRSASAQTGMTIYPTCLAAHMVPLEYKDSPDKYLQIICNELLPAVKEQKLAVAADIFIETGAFDVVRARTYLETAKDLGFALRVHADQFESLGGTELAVELGAQSVDHLEVLHDSGMEALAMTRKTYGGLLPSVPHFLRQQADAPARRLIQAGVPYFVATDFNPGSSYSASLPEAAHFARVRLNLSAQEAFLGITQHAAASLGVADVKGSLAPGFDADFVLCDLPDLHHLGYGFGENPVRRVFVAGKELNLS
ncbi:MAG: imidazolonepropionase [Planctomycetes bacterium]|nr:imidazolonepropionase [Planctomycetota bacterium]